jgi:hypothetical protein
MTPNETKRNKNNDKHHIPMMIMISNTENELYQDAVLFDIKKREIIFESSLDPKPGSDVSIRIEDDVPGSDRGCSSKSCRARVKWCREHLDGYTFNYRIGVQLSEAATCFNN